MEEIRENLKQANELITQSIRDMEEIAPIEIETIDMLREIRITTGGIISEIDKSPL